MGQGDRGLRGQGDRGDCCKEIEGCKVKGQGDRGVQD